MKASDIAFTNNPAIIGKENRYETIIIDADKALKSWQKSIFSFEWLNKDGEIKPLEELSEREKPKREQIEKLIEERQPISQAILGIGIQDNIEIGIGRAHFLTAVSKGIKKLPVHIRKSNIDDFKRFVSE